jgi:hypothetical protein
MTDQTQFLMNQAVLAIKAGDLAGGRKLLESVLETDPNNENAWLWMSAAVTTDVERRHCLEQILILNPDNTQAKRGLEKLGGTPEAEGEAGSFESLRDEFAAFDTSKEESGDSTTGSVPAFTWALEPEQRDLAPETSSEEADLEALFKSFDAASESKDAEKQSFDWTFDEPAESPKPGASEEAFGSEESLNRFLGIEPTKENLRGFYEEDARQGKPVPAFTFDEEPEAEAVDNSSDAFVSPPLPDTDFSFDIDKITSETPPPPEETFAVPQPPGTKAESGLKLWAYPGGKANSVIILRDEYLILANPDALFIDRIREEVERGEVKKKSLGRTAKVVPLKSLLRIQGEPEAPNFTVVHAKGKDKILLNAEFETTEVRDEAMDAVLEQLGLGFQRVEENVKRSRLMIGPLFLLVIALLGTPLLVYLSTLLLGAPAGFDDLSLRLIVPVVIGVIGFVVFVAALIWLLRKMRQPEHLVAIVPAAGMEL